MRLIWSKILWEFFVKSGCLNWEVYLPSNKRKVKVNLGIFERNTEFFQLKQVSEHPNNWTNCWSTFKSSKKNRPIYSIKFTNFVPKLQVKDICKSSIKQNIPIKISSTLDCENFLFNIPSDRKMFGKWKGEGLH